MTLSGQCKLSVGFKALQVVCGGAAWQLLGWGESQSSEVSSAMSSDCVSDISRSLRMLSGWARVTSRRPSLSDTPGERPRGESKTTPLLRELQSRGSSPEPGAMAEVGGARSSSVVKHRWLGLVSMSTWISRLVPSLEHNRLYRS